MSRRGPSARELRRQAERTARASKGRSPRVPAQARGTPLLVGTYLVFSPLEAILDQLEHDGTLTCSPRGRPMFRDLTDGNWYDTAAAMAGVIDHLEMYETRHGVRLPLDGMRQFHRFIDHGMNIPGSLIKQLRRDLPTLQRIIALSNPDDIIDLFRQVQIKIEMEKLAEAEQPA